MASLGNNQKAYICDLAGDITYGPDAIWLGGETANALNRGQEAVECSDKSDGWAKYIAAKKSGTFEVTVYADNTDEGQVLALNSLHLGSKVRYAVGINLDSEDHGDDYEYGIGVVTAVSDTNDFGAVASRQITIQSDRSINPGYLEEIVTEEPAEPLPDDPSEPAGPDEEEQG